MLLFQLDLSSARKVCNEDELEVAFSSLVDVCSSLRLSLVSKMELGDSSCLFFHVFATPLINSC